MSERIEKARERLRQAHEDLRRAGGAVVAARGALDRAATMTEEIKAEHDALISAERIEVGRGASGLVTAIKAGLMQRPEAPADVSRSSAHRAEVEYRRDAIALARQGLDDEYAAAREVHRHGEAEVEAAATQVVAAHCADLADDVKSAARHLAHLHADLNALATNVLFRPGDDRGDVLDAGQYVLNVPSIHVTELLTDWAAFRLRLVTDPDAVPV